MGMVRQQKYQSFSSFCPHSSNRRFGYTLIATKNKELNHSSWHKEITPLPSPIIPEQTNAILKVMVAIGIPCYN
jgi:hypothetical protein